MSKRGFILNQTIRFTAYLTLIMITANLSSCESSEYFTPPGDFHQEIIDPSGPRASWGKAVGDINGDGLLDIVVGGQKPRKLTLYEKVQRKLGVFDSSRTGGELIWYKNPTWERHTITEDYRVRTDIEVADINSDGQNDILLTTNQGVVWLDGHDWSAHPISPLVLHDIAVADLDNDGDLDVIGRNQTLFGHENGHQVHILSQDNSQRFRHIQLTTRHGEGLAVADMDADGYKDIIVNQEWIKNPGILTQEVVWQRYQYAYDWTWQDVFIDVVDVNADRRPDIILAPAEQAGQYYRLSWFEAPGGGSGTWTEHIVDPRVEAVSHFVAGRDIDRDGHIDILTAEMNQGDGDNPVRLYRYTENGWLKQRVASTPGHSLKAIDIDNDFDIDLIGTNWQFEDPEQDYPVYLWRNKLAKSINWQRHLIDDDRPGQAIFILSSDLDDDGLNDLASGGYWYQQPDQLEKTWSRSKFGDPASNVLLLEDFDSDGNTDVLASGWRGYNQRPSAMVRLLNRLNLVEYNYSQSGADLVWARNDGSGRFTLHKNIESGSGDFLQGAELLKNTENSTKVLLSWHREGEGLQVVNVPDNPLIDAWTWRRLTPYSQDEEVTSIDVDHDGHPDILTGTSWLKWSSSGWTMHRISETTDKPDRHVTEDINGDGRLDVVVGFEAVSRPGKLVWYEQPEDATELWIEHKLPTLIGPMSLDVADVDLDGDTDVIVGEHNLDHPELARILWIENLDAKGNLWRPHLIHQGDEHHNGALAVDLDNDGDVDIASIGWSHGKVLVYENLIH